MSLYRSFATVGSLTMVSRVLGFVRDILIAAVLGTGAVADAFFVAFRIPNLFRRVFAEGAFNAAFVPLFSKRLEGEGMSAARRFAEEALALLFATLLVLTALAEIAMPWLMYLIAWGFADTPEKFDLAVLLSRIAFPYLLCMSLVALLSGVLNALGRFAVAAAAPILLNVVLISVMVGVAWAGFGNTPEAGIALSWGVAAAGLLQLVVLGLWARRFGMGLRLRRPRYTASVHRLVCLGLPGVAAASVTQLNIFIGGLIASFQDSAVSWLYYADRIYQLPLGLVGIAIGVVLLPDLSRKLRSGDDAAALASQNRSLELSLLLTLPAAVALAVVPEPIIRVLFERGAFSASDTAATVAALAWFAAGLPAFVLIKVFSPGFFARENTLTPMYYAVASVVVNVAGSLALFPSLGHVGIAIATTAAGWVNALLLAGTLFRQGNFAFDATFRRRAIPIVVSSAVMGLALWGADTALAPWFAPSNGLFVQVAALGGLVLGGLLVYAAAAQLSGATHLPSLLRGMTRGG
ncbi:MAG: murein biosynthesis integral membrane protein MurJ [Hyphomicrobiales bacterium]|nr:murein biosynthesis integral membrane protein MurJ [Hyphomicrobiales bacterium]